MLSEMFWVFQKKKKFYKEKCGTVKNCNVKNVIIKKVSYESFSSMYTIAFLGTYH